MNNNYSSLRQKRRSILTTKSLTWFLLGLITLLTSTVQAQVSGKVFREMNMNGVADAAITNTFRDQAGGNSTTINTRYSEVGLPGATITVYGDNELILGTATTSSTGSWTVTIPGTYTGLYVLVECSPPGSLSILQTGPHGTDNNTTVARVLKNATNVNFTFGLGSEHAQNSPDLAQACFAIPDPTTANGNPGSTEPMVIRFPYISGGPLIDGTRQTAGSSVATNTGQNYYSATEYPPVTTKTVLTTFGATGSVYGVAYDKRRNRLLTSAFERAYTGLGAAGAGGEGKIYVTTLATSGTATGTTVWLDLETALSNTAVAGIDPVIPAGLVATTAVAGSANPVTVVRFEHNKVGHLSLGDLEFSADGRTVFVVNLYSKQIYGIPLNVDGTPNSAGIRTYTPINPCTGVAFTDPASPSPASRPTNALLGLGIHPENGLVYCTVTCTGQNASDLKGYVYSFDPAAATPVFTQELQIPLSFSLQTGGTGTEGVYGTKVNAPWSTSANNAIVANNLDNNMVEQPWLADVVFDVQPDGTIYMLVGGRNRFTDAVSGSRITTGQGMWIAALNNNAWSLESNGTVGTRTTANTLTLPWFSVRNGNGVFFNTNGSEGADGTGNLVAVPGFTEVAMSGIDNVKSGGNNGVSFMRRDNGSRTRDILLLGSLLSGTADRGGVYKANVWGEVEALLNPAPLEVGNYVFIDLNKNGLQDPSDLPLAGVTVSLVEDTNSDGLPNETTVASTTTDANGQYYFDQTDGLKYDTKYVLVINKSTDFTTGVLASMSATVANVNANSKDFRDSDGELFGANQYAKVAFTTGGPGENNHLFDFGFTLPPCNPPVLAVSASQSICQGGSFTLPLSASVTSSTATGQQWYLTDAIGSSFTAIAGATSLTFTPTGANLPTSTGGTKYYAITAYNGTTICSQTAFVSLTIKPTQTITISAPTAATVTQCANTTLNISVSTNAVAPDGVQFVYFTSPQSGTAMYTGGVVLGSVTSTTVTGTKTLTRTITLPANAGTTIQTLYVYAILTSVDGSCNPVDSFVLNVTPSPIAVIGGASTVCQGTSTTLTLPPGLSYRWSTGVVTRQITPTISATTTSAVYSATLTSVDGCASDPATFTVTGVACTSCVAGAGRVGGTIYNDFDANGVKAASEPGLSGITVKIYACDASGSSTLAGTTTTDFLGNYFFSGLTDGTTYRVEFSNVPSQFAQSSQGLNSGTSVQFVKSPSCGVSLGLSDPTNYCETNPAIAVVCFARNTDGTTEPTIITIKDNDATNFVARAATDATGDWAAPTGTLPIAPKTTIGNVGNVGTTMGLTWDKTHKQILTGSYMRAFAPMKNGTNGFGEGVIYAISYASGTAATPTAWLDLETVLGAGVSGTFVADATFPDPNSISGRANSNPAKIGYTGLGSIKIADDDSEVYVVNLNKQEVIVIPADATGAPISGSLKRFPLPTDGCPTGAWADGRPYMAVLGLGVHPTTRRVYATVTCTGPTANDLKGLVYSVDPSDATPASSDFRLEATIPLNTDIPATNPNVSNWYAQQVHPWEVVTANSIFYTNTSTFAQHTHPWLGEIAFDKQSDGLYGMTVSTRNRYHDIINASWYVTGGVLQRLANTGSDASPVWMLESNAVAGDRVSTVNWTLNNASAAGGNTGLTNRFFKYVGREGSMVGGLIDYVPGRPEVVVPGMDNIYYSGNSGISWISRLTGERSRDIHLIGDNAYAPAGYYATNFPKANNWGGVTVLCNEDPIQIGNRVWRDDNRNGIQDPCEPAIPGAVVKLYDAAKTTVLASATTNAAGEYYFSSATVVAGTSTSSVSTSLLTYNTTYGLVITSLGSSTVVTGLGLTDVSPLTPGESGSINSGLTSINNDAKIDVVGGISSPCIKLTTGGPGETNHTYDFGIVKNTCSLTAMAISTTCNPATNQYSVNGTISLTGTVGGTGTITDGAVSKTVSVAASATSVAYSLTGLVSNGASHTVTVSLPGCGSAVVLYTAPASCSVAPCTIDITSVTPSACNPATNTYSVSLVITYSNPPTGSIQISTNRGGTVTVPQTGSPQTIVISQIPSDGLSVNVSAEFVANSNCSKVILNAFTAPQACQPSLTVAVGTPVCNTITNNYTASGTVSLSNTPANATLTITDNGLVVSAQPLTVGQTTVSFTLTGVSGSSPASHSVVATLANGVTVISSTTYATPASCTVCSLSVTASAAVTICVGQSATLTAAATGGNPAYTYLWQPSATLSGANTATAVATPTTTTTYSVIVTDARNCTALATVAVVVNGMPSIVSLVRGTCVGSLVSVTANASLTGAGTLEYSFNGGVFQPANTTTITANSPTPIVVVVRTVGSTCTVTQSTTVDCACQNPANVSLLPASPATCGQTPVSLTASVSGGTTSGTMTSSGTGVFSTSLVNGSITVTYTPSVADVTAGSVTLTITSADPDGTGLCLPVSQSRVLVINPVPIVALPSVTMCSGVSATLTATAGANAYTFAPAGGVQTGNMYVVSPSATTIYSVTAITGSCSGTATGTVMTFPKPTVGDSQTLVCTNGQVPTSTTLTAQTNSSVLTGQWYAQPGNPSATTFANATSLTTTVSGLLPGLSYTFVWANTSGCASGLTVTVGMCATVAPASLGDKVFADNNRNGIQDTGDTPIPGVTVTLISNGTVVATTTTLSSGTGIGCYSFTGLTPGLPYSVSFTTPAGLTATTPLSGTDKTKDSDPVGGITAPVTLTAGENNPTIDAGFVPLLASLGDYVWYDLNTNGQQDGTETGVSNVTVTLCDATSGTVISTTLTDGAGKYLFTNLNPGSYVVKFTAPAGTTFTTPNSGTDGTDSDVASLTGQKGSTGVYSLSGGEQNLTVDAGLIPLLGSIGDFVWKDANNNGQQDTGEPGVANVTVQLYTVVNGVISNTALASTVTSTSGLYTFSGLPSGQYQVKFTLSPTLSASCAISPKPNTGPDDKDSDVDPLTGLSPVITIDVTQPSSSTARNNPTIDMGLRPLPTAVISDPCQCFRVEWDLGEVRELYETLQINSSSGETWTVVSQRGMLSLDTLVKHPVLVGTPIPETAAGSGIYQLSYTHEDGVGYSVTVTNGTAVLVMANVCNQYSPYTTTVLSQTLCRNAAPVALTAAASMPSTAQFFYVDKNTKQRVYITQFDPRQFAEGDTIYVKLDITPLDQTKCEFIIVQKVLISSVECKASLGDKVFADNNRNGIQDTGDTPIPGVTVTLISNGTVVATTTTLSSGTGIGCYSFTGLTPGVPYSVSFTTPAGLTATTPLSGTDKTKDSDPVGGITAPVTLTAGENNPTIDAGFVPILGSIGSRVWKDLNQNGQYDSGSEVGVNGVTVRLLQVTSPPGSTLVSTTLVSTTVTTGGGLYEFTGLPQGSYIVEFDKATFPADCQLSPNNNAPGVPDSLNSDADPTSGRSPIIELLPGDPTKTVILSIDAGLIIDPCLTAPKCVPITIGKIVKSGR